MHHRHPEPELAAKKTGSDLKFRMLTDIGLSGNVGSAISKPGMVKNVEIAVRLSLLSRTSTGISTYDSTGWISDF